MPTNDFLPFCPTDTGTNLESQSNYLVDTQRTNGNQPGVASSQLNNKALRQATFITSQLAQFISDGLNNNVLDDGNTNEFYAQLQAIFFKKVPIFTSYLSGSGTWQKTYSFKILSGNATAGATYTNNSFTYTVKSTISAGIFLETTGTGAPTVSGTLTKASGTGDSSITFYAVQSALYLRVRAAGGGGGGGSQTGAGVTGSTTTFGSSLITCTGGTGGLANGAVGAPVTGGTATLGTGAVGLAISGGSGQGSQDFSTGATGEAPHGGQGGSNPLGGGGAGGGANAGAYAAGSGAANTGAGGGGNATASQKSGGGGAAGGYIDAIVAAPAATYAYVVGAGGAAGTGTIQGGAGAAGIIMVEEFFQ